MQDGVMVTDFDRAIQAHDDALRLRDMVVWLGAEPTFTDRFSESSEWLTEALGGDKAQRALGMLARLTAHRPGAAVLRTVGRQYPGEARPRWSFGLYERRDGRAVWYGPPDPALGGTESGPEARERLAACLIAECQNRGWHAGRVTIDADGIARVVLRMDAQAPVTDPELEPGLLRPSIHGQPIPTNGLQDVLAEAGLYLFRIHASADSPGHVPAVRVELPATGSVERFQTLLEILGRAARSADVGGLVLEGHPPPVDASVAWTTLTPDPAVIEVNQAPAPDTATFIRWNRELFAVAETMALAPYRLHYNGVISDSGGGGQITLGGPAPLASPFFVHPQLLPRLIRYFNRHPALSYWFAPPSIGSGSQAPRTDEGVRESFAELAVALEQLGQAERVAPELLWRSLSPFLCDAAGNTHRAELNIEKLWNPYIPDRGCLGLVEFRAFRMGMDPETMAALGVLLRAILAMLARDDVVPELTDWGPILHERFALPFYLRLDLEEVLRDLDLAGLGLAGPLTQRLLDSSRRELGRFELEGCVLEIEQALEFWPLIGDITAHVGSGSRLVDASTARIQILLRSGSSAPADLDGWRLSTDGYRVPLRQDADRGRVVALLGLRYRSFVPWNGLHPGIGAHGPIHLLLTHPAHPRALALTLHEWRADNLPYDGLPADLAVAKQRRVERVVARVVDHVGQGEILEPPPKAVGGYTLDLRRL